MSKRNKGVVVEQTYTVSDGIGNYSADDLDKIYDIANVLLAEAFEVRAIAHSQATASGQLAEDELKAVSHQAKLEAQSFAIIRSALRQHVKERLELEGLRAELELAREIIEGYQED